MFFPFVLLAACSEDTLGIDGTLEDQTGAPWGDVALVEVITWEVWTGELGNDEGFYVSTEVEGASFSFEVPPGHYAVNAARGTCSGLVEVTGEAGEVLEPALTIVCSE